MILPGSMSQSVWSYANSKYISTTTTCAVLHSMRQLTNGEVY